MISLVYLFVEQTVNDEEEGALLRVQNDEHDLKEKICLVQTQNPGTAQYDKLGYNLEQNQPVKKNVKLVKSDFFLYIIKQISHKICDECLYLVSLD